MKITSKELVKYFDHTLLKAFATEDDFKKLCDEAMKYGFKMVAINSVPVSFCRNYMGDSPVHVGAAISFPLGQMPIETKVFEALKAIDDGADEIDYVLNVGKVKEGNYDYIKKEMQAMVSAVHARKILIKVIFETCYLTKDEIKKCAEVAREVKPDFVKTSTGFGTGGAKVEDVKLMKETVGEAVKVKASGGIRTCADCLSMIEAGAERIGLSSSISILEEFIEKFEK